VIEKSRAVGIILGITALVVLVPVILQLRARERRFADVWGHFIFVAGLLCVAAGYGLFADRRQRYLAIGGLVAALIGLFIQHRDKDSEAQ
jgi:hypothetical protein